jgi:hypothetical protein
LRPSTVAKAIDDRSNVSTSSANRVAGHLAACSGRLVPSGKYWRSVRLVLHCRLPVHRMGHRVVATSMREPGATKATRICDARLNPLSWVRRPCGRRPTGPVDEPGRAPGQHKTNRQTTCANAGHIDSVYRDRVGPTAPIATRWPWRRWHCVECRGGPPSARTAALRSLPTSGCPS